MTTPPAFRDLPAHDERPLNRADLSTVLDELLTLRAQGIEAHAHFVGTRFDAMQRHVAALVDTVREASRVVGTLAGHSVADAAAGGAPPLAVTAPRLGERCVTAAERMLSLRITRLVDAMRRAEARSDDVSTARMLHALAESFETHAEQLARESVRVAAGSAAVNLPSAADLVEPPARPGRRECIR